MNFKSVPFIFTFANLIAGVLSLVATIDGRLVQSAEMILLGGVFDWLDGRLARRFKVTTAFGKEMDSLSDLVSFGVAPALLVYTKQLQLYGHLGLAISLLFILGGAFRLARYNVSIAVEHFQGLPITVSGIVIAVFLLQPVSLPWFFLPVLVIVLTALMVSRVKVPKL